MAETTETIVSVPISSCRRLISLYPEEGAAELSGAIEADATMDPKLQQWMDARKRHHPSHAHVQMARELGLKLCPAGVVE